MAKEENKREEEERNDREREAFDLETHKQKLSKKLRNLQEKSVSGFNPLLLFSLALIHKENVEKMLFD